MTSIYGDKLKIMNRIQVKAGLSWIKNLGLNDVSFGDCDAYV